MRNRFVSSSLLAVVAAVLLAGPTFGLSWFSHNSSTKSTNVDIVYHVKFANGSSLKPGNYKLEIPLNTKTPNLKFYQNGKLVATVPAQVKHAARKTPTTEISYRQEGKTHYMTEVIPGGLYETLIVSKSSDERSGS